MHTEAVTLQRVFSVVRREWKGRRWTEFGFNAPGRTVYSACVYGHPDIQEAMQLTMALPRREAWGAICGWFDHGGGAIHVEKTTADWSWIATFTFCLAYLIINGAIDWHRRSAGQLAGFAVVAICITFGLLFFGVRLVRKIRARRQLLRLFPDARLEAS